MQEIFQGRLTGSFNVNSQLICEFAYIDGSTTGYMASRGDNPVGHVEITKYYTIQNIVSGTFYFDGDLKRFTKGSFSNVPLLMY